MSKDYYKILGVSKGAGADEIKSAYRKKAKEFHPDINKSPDASDKFKEINEAYEVLSDSQKRSNYDHFGSDGPQQGFSGQGGFGGHGFSQDDLGDIFEGFFGFGGKKKTQTATVGENIEVILNLSLEDVYTGLKDQVLKVNSYVKCGDCEGKGGKGGISTCKDCRGTGNRSQSHGFISFSSTCGSCGGSGQNMENRCKPCTGEGRKSQSHEIKLNIPMGVDSGSTLRYAGMGHAGVRGGKNGDLYLTVKVKENSVFKRSGIDLIVEKQVDLIDMVCGCIFDIIGIDKKVIPVAVPRNSCHGDRIIIVKHGMRQSSHQHGNLIVVLSMKKPNLSAEQIEKIRHLLK